MGTRLLAILAASCFAVPAIVGAQEPAAPAAPASPATPPASAATPPASEPEGGFKWFGNVGIGGIYTDWNSLNKWKLFEYRDMSNGVLSNIELHGRGGRDYVDFFAENIGRTDAFFDLRGGRYNAFKYSLYGNWLDHALSFGPYGGRSPYFGVGTNVLTTTFPALNSFVPPWNSFDFENKRRVLGGSFELSNIYVSPWYARADVNQIRQQGVYPGSAANGTSPGNGFTDLPAPIDYVTNTWAVEGGYSTRQAQVGINFLSSKFTNDNTLLFWTNPFFGGNNYDISTLAPSSDLWKISINGALRQLPGNSTLAGRVTYSQLTNSVGILGAMLNTGPVYTPTNPSAPTFEGKVETTSVTASFTSNPVRPFDYRLYFNYYDRANSSSTITFLSPTLGCPTRSDCTTLPFSYTRQNYGAEAGYRFNPQNRLSGTIDYQHFDQDRRDYPNASQWTYGLQWRNSSIDTLGILAGISYLQRRPEFALANAGANANDPLFLERYVARYDLSNLDQTRLRLVLDWGPMPFLDFGLEAYFKYNDFQPNPNLAPLLGRTKDQRQEYYGSVSYGDPQSLRVTFFGDIEWIWYDSQHRTINNVTGDPPVCTAASPNCYNPNTPPNSGAFNWNARNNDKNWALGTGLDWQALTRLLVKGSAIWYRTQGWADIASQNNFGNPMPIYSYDTTSRVSVNLKGIYSYDRHWQFTVGTAFEQYRYSDIAYNGYQYTIPAGTPPNFFGTSYLSGAYAFPNYRANIWYAMANYKFF